MNLFKVEMMKIRMSVYLWAMLGIFISLQALGILYLFLGGTESEDEELFTSWNGLFALSTAMTVACFSILSAVVAAKIIVDEYCGKNSVILFTYPVSRKKILNIKCTIILCITTVSAFISNTLVIGIMYITSKIFGIEPEMTERYFLFSVLLSGFLAGILSSAIGIISAVAGWKKRSVMTAIICSLILVCFVPNYIAGSPDNIVLVMFIVSVCFVLVADRLYHMLAKGIEGMEV